MPILYPTKTTMPTARRDRAPGAVGRGRRRLHGRARARGGAPLHPVPGPALRAGLPCRRADPRLHPPRRARGLQRRRRAHPHEERAARDLRARLPGRAPVRGPVLRARAPGAGRDRTARAVRRRLGARASARRRSPAGEAARGEDRDRRLRPGRADRRERPRAARLPGHRLRGAARDRRSAALRHPRVPPAEGDRRRGRRAPARRRGQVRDERDHRQDGDDRRAARRARLRRRLRRHRRRLAEVHEHPRREPQGRLLRERVPHAREPHARVLLPRLRHARPAPDARRRDRRRRHGDGRRARVDPPRGRGGAHRLPAHAGRDGRAGRGLPARRRGRHDLRLADAAEALPRRRRRPRVRDGVRPHGAGRARRVGPAAAGSDRGLRLRARVQPRRDRARHQPESARPATTVGPRDRQARLRRHRPGDRARQAARASTPAATSPPERRP